MSGSSSSRRRRRQAVHSQTAIGASQSDENISEVTERRATCSRLPAKRAATSESGGEAAAGSPAARSATTGGACAGPGAGRKRSAEAAWISPSAASPKTTSS